MAIIQNRHSLELHNNLTIANEVSFIRLFQHFSLVLNGQFLFSFIRNTTSNEFLL